MDKNDEALRETINKLWPVQAKKICHTLVPPNEGEMGPLCSVRLYAFICKTIA